MRCVLSSRPLGLIEVAARWWMVALPAAVAVSGIAVVGHSLLGGPSGEGEDWSVLVGGALLAVAVVALATNLPCFILVRSVKHSPSSPKTRLALSLAVCPLVGASLPVFGEFRITFVVGAIASAPYVAVRILGRLITEGATR